jgi:hypothetical protein
VDDLPAGRPEAQGTVGVAKTGLVIPGCRGVAGIAGEGRLAVGVGIVGVGAFPWLVDLAGLAFGVAPPGTGLLVCTSIVMLLMLSRIVLTRFLHWA